MSIKILPPQLANQIAAGEVVERPASVVKELVENALDAGASQIDIEIDKGGHKRILIRDDGKGISKDELSLALSRHATSKITDIDDLEAIVSLGFRGEALASISSVSRLTMTSKPKQQSEAWSAIAEGLDMAVKVLPAAHPNGTSVEVLDLFFNTPARRKFLRAEKTEFSHIESLIKRIALSRPDVAFVLKHNGKLVKRYRSQAKIEDTLARTSNRIGEVINGQFVDNANAVSSQYDQVNISVWVKAPELCVSVNPAQYSFVNGRMMRDKLIQHAIRQAYGSLLGSEQLPEYVVFIELPAQDVDVNVHPAKHEVRFHYARLLHDFLVKIMEEALAGFNQQQALVEEPTPDWLAVPNDITTQAQTQQAYQQATAATEIVKSELKPSTSSAGNNQSKPSGSQRFPGLKPLVRSDNKPSFEKLAQSVEQIDIDTQARASTAQSGSDLFASQAQGVIDQGVSDQETSTDQLQASDVTPSEPLDSAPLSAKSSDVTLLHVEAKRYGYFTFKQQLWLVDLTQIFDSNVPSLTPEQLQASPLLVPVRLKLTEAEKHWCDQQTSQLSEQGFECKRHQDYLIIKQVPAVLRSMGSAQTLPSLFTELMKCDKLTTQVLIALISDVKSADYTQSQLQQKLTQWVTENKRNLKQFAKPLRGQDILS